MFAAMMDAIKEESVGFLFNLEVEVQENPIVEEAPGPAPVTAASPPAPGSAPARPANGTGAGSQKNQPQRSRAGGRSRPPARGGGQGGNGQGGNGQGGNRQGGNGQGGNRQRRAYPRARRGYGAAGGGARAAAAAGTAHCRAAPSADEPGQVEQHPSAPSEGDQFSRVGRNDLCPCRSGRRFRGRAPRRSP